MGLPLKKAALILLCFSALSVGCTGRGGCNGSSESSSGNSQLEAPPRNSSLFAFDTKAIRQLLVARFDAKAGEAWTARLVRAEEATDAQVNNRAEPTWFLRSLSTQPSLSDPRADGNFVQHLIDTLLSLRVESHEPDAPAGTYGLENPRFALRWSEREGEGGYELLVGDRNPRSEGGVFVRLPGGPVITVRGAALQMLEMIESPDTLRQRRWVTLSRDDVDEIELSGSGITRTYAERASDHWTDRKGRKLKPDLDAFLEGVTHLRIKRFMDINTAAENDALSKWVAERPDRELVLSDRNGKAFRFLARMKGFPSGESLLLATASNRPGALFELYPESLGRLTLKGF